MIDSELSEILSRLDIAAYLDNEGVDYRETHGSSGAQLNLRECPKCGTAKWKVFLNADTGLGNCFSGSCEARFNKFSFIRHSSGLGGRALDEHIRGVGAAIGWRPPRKSVAVVTDVAGLKLPSSLALPINGRNLAYLENRGIGIETAKYFALRYCHKGLWLYRDEYGAKRFVDFGRRVIIPIFDLDGGLVSFQGRDVTGSAEKKYLFPNGFASTGEHLYNGHNALRTERLLIGEGAFDVAAQKVALDGDPDLRDVVPVGSFGKHVAPGQVAKFQALLERGVRHLTFMWDGELKATDDAVQAGLQLIGLGFKVSIALLPPDKDPNEVSAEVVRAAFYSAIPLSLSSATKILMKRRLGIFSGS